METLPRNQSMAHDRPDFSSNGPTRSAPSRGRQPRGGKSRTNSAGKGGGEDVPTTEELRGAVFAHGTTFRVKEKVAVPRSRGGFTLGYIAKPVPRRHCYVDPTTPVSANHQEWRVVYKNGKGEPLFKDLPPASLGKLRPGAGPKPVTILSRGPPAAGAAGNGAEQQQAEQPKAKSLEEGVDDDASGGSHSGDSGSSNGSRNSSSNSAGDGDDDDDDEEIFVFRGVHSAPAVDAPKAPLSVENGKHASPAVASPAAPVAQPTERRLGGLVLEKDLMAVSFSPTNTFKEGELVVVPRSAGGFTYGTVQGRCECLCPIGPPAHKHLGWRVNVDQAVPKPNFKDIFSAHLGKLHLAAAATPGSLPAVAAANGARAGAGSAPSPRRKDSGSGGGHHQPRQAAPAAPHAAPAGPSRRQQRARNYEFAEVGEGEANKPAPTFDQPDEYDFQLTSSTAPSRPATGQPTPGSTAAVNGAAKYEKDDDEDDEDYFDEYDDDQDQVEQQQQPQPAVPTFSGLFGLSSASSSSSVVAPVNRVQPPQQKQKQQAVAQEAVDASKAGPSPAAAAPQALDTAKKGVLCVPNLPQPVKKGHGHHQPRRTLSLGQRTFKERGPRVRVEKPVIVIDAPNVAMRHANNKRVSVRGIQLAIQYWEKKGHQVIAFIPEHYLSRKAPPPGQVQTVGEYMPMADDPDLLARLVDAGSVVLCPPQDYDDSYCIEYSKRHGAYIVTNDRYWDHIARQPEDQRRGVTKWLREHCISFTFAKNEFLPNPDFAFLPAVPQTAEAEAEK